MIRTLIVSTAAGGDAPPPAALIQLHLPRVLAVQGRLVPRSLGVQVHHLQVSERLHEVRVRYPKKRDALMQGRALRVLIYCLRA